MPQNRPAIIGGPPILLDKVPLVRPATAFDDDIQQMFRRILDSGALTKGPHLNMFEAEVTEFLGVGHAVVVSSCTTGLMLLMRCLGLRGEVVLPGFTFMASAHALRWNGLTPAFADVDPRTFTLTAATAEEMIGERTAAVLSVHTFGTPSDSEALARVAARRGVPLIIDAAPAFGAEYSDGDMVGRKGLAEVFSLSPTKPFTTGEGGIITTADAGLAQELRVAREYGNAGDFDSATIGLNGRMPELSAALGRHLLRHVPAQLHRRRLIADRYRRGLGDLPGVGFQHIPQGATSTLKDFCLTIDPPAFGLDRDALVEALSAEGVETRNYYDPPVHRQAAYRGVGHGRALPVSELVAKRALTIPLHPRLTDVVADQICEVVHRIHRHAEETGAEVARRRPPAMASAGSVRGDESR